jgi:oxalate decarboxylase
VWYFRRGHGYQLECQGDRPTHFIPIFDDGYFSEFGTSSITDWIGHVPKPLLAKNFGLPESAFAGFPKCEVYFGRGAAGRPPPRRQPACLPHAGPQVNSRRNPGKLPGGRPTSDALKSLLPGPCQCKGVNRAR